MTSATGNITGTLRHLFEAQKRKSQVLRSEPIANRKARLSKLRSWILSNRERIHEAMFKDFRKPAQEVDAIELFHVLNEIRYALKNVDSWTRPQKVDAPLTMLGSRSRIIFEPKGVCLIISPWNYPLSLCLGPLVSAIAAGNTAIMKPSELTPNTARLLADLVPAVFPPDEVAVVEGDAEVAGKLLSLPFDHIFFTGSTSVGKLVMKAAAETLASVTLELGGKSPAIVSEDCTLTEAAERIAVAKFVNNGQTCIAPDYILAHRSISNSLAMAVAEQVKKRFAPNGDFISSESYGRIVNARHTERLLNLSNDAVVRGAKITLTGEHVAGERFLHPTILTDVPLDSEIMKQEIFGPVLPVLPYDSLQDAIDVINGRPKPLALYIFSNRTAIQEDVLKKTTAGGVCINDCGIHFLNHNLPFGGVNHSGMGKSHGYFGFKAFSNLKPVLHQRNGYTTVKMFYPPYTTRSRKLMDWFLNLFS
jgi:aldehyde dehydrogenase (NAD+)